MAKTTDIKADEISVTEQMADNPDGTKAFNTWRGNPDQINKHVAETFQKHQQKLSGGDVSAIADAANEYNKQKKS